MRWLQVFKQRAVQPPETRRGLVNLVDEGLVIFADWLFLSILGGVFRYYHSGLITAVCWRWHSMDGAGLKKQVGVHCLSSQPARPEVPWAWGPLHHSLGLQMGVGTKPGQAPGTLPWTDTATWVPTAPITYGVCVVKMERTAGGKGGLRGQRSAHGAKECCLSWEGKGGKTTQTFLSLQGCQSPALSFLRGKCCTFRFEWLNYWLVRSCGTQVGSISYHKNYLVERFLFLPRWNFFLWHVMSSCFSRWRQGSSCQGPLGGGEGWEWLCRRHHRAAVGLQAREAGLSLLPLDSWTPLAGQASHLAPLTPCLFAQLQLAGWYFWRQSIFAGSTGFFFIPAACRKIKKIERKKGKLKFLRTSPDAAHVFHSMISDVGKSIGFSLSGQQMGVLSRTLFYLVFCCFTFPSGSQHGTQSPAGLPCSSTAMWSWSVCQGSAVPLQLDPVSFLWFPKGQFQDETSSVCHQFLPI